MTTDVMDKPAEAVQKPPETTAQPAPSFNWRTEIPEEVRDEKTGKAVFKDIADLKALAKNYYEAQTYIGGAVKVPKEDASPEELSKFYAKLGRPETVEGYKVNRPAVEDGEWDEATEKKFLTQVHGLGLNNRQVQGIFDWLGALTEETLKEGQVGLEKTTEELQKEWGSNYNRNVAFAQRTVQQLGGDEVRKLLDDSRLGNHPAFVRLFAKIGKELAEDGIIPGAIEGIPGKEEAQQKVNEIMGDRKGPYWDRNHPDHERTIQKVQELMRLIHE